MTWCEFVKPKTKLDEAEWKPQDSQAVLNLYYSRSDDVATVVIYITNSMGCSQITGIKTFVPNENIEGQGEAALEVFMNLGLEPKDLNLLYTCFWDIDADDSGSISPIELFTYFNLDLGPFEKNIFSVFDDDKTGVLNFMEFVCCMWNLLTFQDKELGIIAFMMKDPTGIYKITQLEVKDLIEMIHRKKVDQSQALQLLYTNLRRQCSAEINIQEFCKWTVDNISVLSPLLLLQLKFRNQIIGEKYWKRMTRDRAENPHLSGFGFVRELQLVVRQRNKMSRDKKAAVLAEAARRERLGLGDDGDTRDNVIKKQSVLLGLFGMKPVAQRSAVYCNEDSQATEPAEAKRGLTKLKPRPSASPSPQIKGMSTSKKTGSSGGSSSKKASSVGSGKSSKKEGRTPNSSTDSSSNNNNGGGNGISAGDGRRRRSIIKPKLLSKEGSSDNR